MPIESGVIEKIYDNPKNYTVQLVGGFRASAFGQRQAGLTEGDTVSFAYDEKPNPTNPAKPYVNIKGAITVTAHGAAPPAGNVATMPQAAPAAPMQRERNGMQVGAALNQAIAAGVQGADEIEAFAQQLLLMGDRLALYEVDYKATKAAEPAATAALGNIVNG